MFDEETDYDIYTDDNFSEVEEFHDAEGSDAEETDDDYQETQDEWNIHPSNPEGLDAEEADNDRQEETQDEWNLMAEGADTRPSPLPEFRPVPGPRADWQPPATADGHEAEFLALYLTDNLFESVTRWTNARPHAVINSGENVPRQMLRWSDCIERKMRRLFSILLLMGLDKKPEISSYWSKDPVFHCAFLAQPQALSRDRFKQILSCVRFYDCTDGQPDTPLAKVEPFLRIVQQLCKENYTPQQCLAVDETLVPYRGRIRFRQYIPSKKAKFGLKVYCLCESSTGYLCNLLVHSTPEENQRFGFGLDCEHLSLSERVVAELCRHLLGEGHRIFTDSWFTSIRLAKWLLQHNTTITGTVRANRGIPPDLRDLPLQPDSAAFARQGDILACKFTDRCKNGPKTVHLLDSAGVAASGFETKRRHGVDVQVRKPATVLLYNRNMIGVDRMHSKDRPYHANRKCFRWFHKLGFHLVLLLVKNAWAVYRHCGGQLDFLAFLRYAITWLVEQTGNGRRPVRRAAVAHQPAVGPAGDGTHLPVKVPKAEGRPRSRKRCRVCSANGRETRTSFTCSACPDAPPLCLGACFGVWHQF